MAWLLMRRRVRIMDQGDGQGSVLTYPVENG